MHDHERDRIIIRRLADKIAELERRLHNVETAPQLQRTSVRGGFTRWMLSEGDAPRIDIGASANDVDVSLFVLDDNGALVANFGTATGTGAELRLENPEFDGTRAALLVQHGKWVTPLISCAWQVDSNVNIDAQGRPTTTSGTYVPLWRAYLPICTGDVMSHIHLFAASNTADVRVQARVLAGGTPGSAQTLVESIGLTGTQLLSGPWTVPDAIVSPASDPVGVLAELAIEVRRTAGSTPVAVAPFAPAVNWPV